MKKLKLIITLMLALYAAAFLIGCDEPRPAAQEETKNNAGYRVDILFTDKDGYTVKRFEDNGHSRYYVTGPGDARTDYNIHAGKSTRRDSISSTN